MCARSDVYLVKGIGSQVGEDVPPSMFPFMIYNMLVYDGLLSGRPLCAGSTKREMIKAKISKAVREESIIYCGTSAANGQWDDEPPELPTFDPIPED